MTASRRVRPARNERREISPVEHCASDTARMRLADRRRVQGIVECADRCWTCSPSISTMATSMPSSEVPLMMPGDSHPLHSFCNIVQQPQRFDGPHFVDFQVTDFLLDPSAPGSKSWICTGASSAGGRALRPRGARCARAASALRGRARSRPSGRPARRATSIP